MNALEKAIQLQKEQMEAKTEEVRLAKKKALTDLLQIELDLHKIREIEDALNTELAIKSNM